MDNNNLETNNQGQEKATETEEKLTFTQAELDALLQKEGDRRVSQAMKKQEGKLKEAQKLAKKLKRKRDSYLLQRTKQKPQRF